MKAFTTAIFILCVVWINVCSLVAQKKANVAFPSATQIQKLNSIGEEISAALLRRDTSVILKYDRPDLREEDSQLLGDNKSDLHCYLFETDCIQWQARSVYDQIREMSRPAVAVKRWGKSADGDPTYLLVFYDKAKINGNGKLSGRFICDHLRNGVVTWTFAYVKGQWVSEHPPFDAEVDSVC